MQVRAGLASCDRPIVWEAASHALTLRATIRTTAFTSGSQLWNRSAGSGVCVSLFPR